MLNTLIAIQTIIINLPQPIISSNTITTALPLLQPNNTRGSLHFEYYLLWYSLCVVMSTPGISSRASALAPVVPLLAYVL